MYQRVSGKTATQRGLTHDTYMTGNCIVHDEIERLLLVHNRWIPDWIQHVQRPVGCGENRLRPPRLADLACRDPFFNSVRRHLGAFDAKADSTGGSDVRRGGENETIESIRIAIVPTLHRHDRPTGAADRPRPPIGVNTAPGNPAVKRGNALAVSGKLKINHRIEPPAGPTRPDRSAENNPVRCDFDRRIFDVRKIIEAPEARKQLVSDIVENLQ